MSADMQAAPTRHSFSVRRQPIIDHGSTSQYQVFTGLQNGYHHAVGYKKIGLILACVSVSYRIGSIGSGNEMLNIRMMGPVFSPSKLPWCFTTL